MGSEKCVVGIDFSTPEQYTILWIRADYTPDYAKNLAKTLEGRYNPPMALDRFRYLIMADLFYNIEESADTIMTTTRPASDHTYHVVDVNHGVVRLLDKFDGKEKVSFNINHFIKRYYPDYNG